MSIFEGKTALIIEDDESSVKVLMTLLEHLQVEVQVISDSYNAKSILAKMKSPDVIFLDLEMPGTNGYSIIEYLKSSSEFHHVPVVAYTTHVSHLNNAKQAGFHSFLSKPINNREFPDHLASILEGTPVWEISE